MRFVASGSLKYWGLVDDSGIPGWRLTELFGDTRQETRRETGSERDEQGDDLNKM